MGGLIQKIIQQSIKQGKKVQEINPSDFMVQDTTSIIIDIAKEIIKPW